MAPKLRSWLITQRIQPLFLLPNSQATDSIAWVKLGFNIHTIVKKHEADRIK